MTSGQQFGALYLMSDNNMIPEGAKSRYPFIDYVKRKMKIGVFDPEDKRKAIVQKSGHFRVKYTGLKSFNAQFIRDFFVTLIDLQWRYVFAILFNVYLFTYFVFAIFWYWIMAAHGDFEHLDDKDWKPCVSGVTSFPGTILFSIETQTSIGYGYAYLNTDCGETLILIFIQISIGILLENVLLGFVFIKFSQPKRRQKTLLFSKTAVINQEDGQLCLQVRVGDMRQSHLLDAKVHGVLIKNHKTDEGVTYPLYLHDVSFQAQGMSDTIVLMWPLVLTHKITPDSPFWDIKPVDLMTEKYELILYIEGTIESTGEFCQARSSYMPNEILWGHRFDRIEEFDAGNGRWEIDFEGFNDVVYCANIRNSAHELFSMKNPSISRNSTSPVTSPSVRPPPPAPPVTVSLHNIPYDTSPDYTFAGSKARLDATITEENETPSKTVISACEYISDENNQDTDTTENDDGFRSVAITSCDEALEDIQEEDRVDNDDDNKQYSSAQEETDDETANDIDEYLSS